MRWHLIIEAFRPELKYIKGENNVVADVLSRLEKSPNQEILNISELYGYDDEDMPDIAYPIRYHDIATAQENDSKLQQKTSLTQILYPRHLSWGRQRHTSWTVVRRAFQSNC